MSVRSNYGLTLHHKNVLDLLSGRRAGTHRHHRRTLRPIYAAAGAVLIGSLAQSQAGAQALNTWIGSASSNWSVGSNWAGGSAPTVDTSGNVNLEFNGSGAYTANNNLGSFYVYNTTFDTTNAVTTLTGGDIDLSWPLSESSNPVFTNNSTNAVTINNNVNFEAPSGVGGTVESFVMAPGSTTTFNGNIGLTGGSGMTMTNGQSATSSGGPGGTMIWTQPVVFTNSPASAFSGYFPFRIYEGTLEMAGYTIDDGTSDAPIINIDGVNLHQMNGVNNGVQTDMYLGPEDRFATYPYTSGDPFLHPNDAASLYLIAGGDSFNTRVQVGDAGTITIGGLNTSGTTYFNDYFLTLPTDGNGAYLDTGLSQTIYYSAATGGTVVQNFQMIRGGGSGSCEASIDKIGGGTWIVNAGGTSPTGEQAYNGNTTVRDGTLELAYDDTGTNNVTLPADVLSNPNAAFYGSGLDGGSLGFNAPTNAVQLGDSGTLPTDNIALLTLINSGTPSAPRQVLHNIQVNNFNPSGTTSIGVADNGTGNFSGDILLKRTVTLTSGTGGTGNFTGNITGTGGVSVVGTGTVNLTGANTYNGSTSVASGGALVVAVAGALPTGTAIANNGTLTINGNSTTGAITGSGTLNIGIAAQTSVVIGTNTGGSSVGALNIAANSALNISNNHLIINYGAGPDPISSIAALLKSGYNGGTWNGSGINSSAAAATAGYGLGYADSADVGNPAGLSSGTLEVKYTLLGDANLDGVVNAVDFGILAANFNKGVNGWDKGDFNYDNVVNAVDFGNLASNFNKGATGADFGPSALSDPALVAFAQANGLMADVPEPVSIASFGIAGLALMSRRRRDRNSI